MVSDTKWGDAVLADIAAERGFWVFTYGSLMWNPGFLFEDHVLARLDGYARAFCMASIVYRGTPEDPGLVLALDLRKGASCTGVAYRIGGDVGPASLDYLRDRELVSSAYQERLVDIDLEDGRRVTALSYVMDPDHSQYRTLDVDAQAAIIARAEGPAGTNRAYLESTVLRLRELGLDDPVLFDVSERVRRLT